MGHGHAIYRLCPSTPRLPAQVMVQFFLRGGCMRGWQDKTPQCSGHHFPCTFERYLLVETMWPQDTEEGLCPGQNGGVSGKKEMEGMEEGPTPGCHQPESPRGILVQSHSYLLSLWPPPPSLPLPLPPPPPPLATPSETHREETGCLIGLLPTPTLPSTNGGSSSPGPSEEVAYHPQREVCIEVQDPKPRNYLIC